MIFVFVFFSWWDSSEPRDWDRFCSTLLVLKLSTQQMQEHRFRESQKDKWTNLLNASDSRVPCAKHLFSGS